MFKFSDLNGLSLVCIGFDRIIREVHIGTMKWC